MHIASAGMPGPLLLSGTDCRVIELSGIPPGLFSQAEYETTTMQLKPGDSLLSCSDGVVEAQNARYEDFGIDWLISICNTSCGSTPHELLSRIFSAVHEFTHVIHQHDDMAAAIFHLQG
jgi:sigma-B regulation protein RsbU (phosphoserine phosphatase)